MPILFQCILFLVFKKERLGGYGWFVYCSVQHCQLSNARKYKKNIMWPRRSNSLRGNFLTLTNPVGKNSNNCNFGGQTASEVVFDLRNDFLDPKNL